MLCAISGEAPQQPVASRKSGTIFEKRLIEAYIQENGKDPVTGEELATDDLIDLKTERIVKPRPPTLTSIPALLSVFQNEWDAIALETFAYKQHVAQLRQELSTALYNNDAAVRVIARITKERDEARDALTRLSVGGQTHSAANGDAMEMDVESLPQDIIARVQETQARLSKTRKKRPVPEGWASAEEMQEYTLAEPVAVLPASGESLSVNATGSQALLAGTDGSSCLYSLESRETLQLTQGTGHAVNDSLFWESESRSLPIVALSSGEVAVLENGEPLVSFSVHAGAATGVALNAVGDLLVSVGVDKSFVLYDLANSKTLLQKFTGSQLSCCQFHPDGHLLAVGCRTGKIEIFDVASLNPAATLESAEGVHKISFSENGLMLAAISGVSTLSIWNLRTASVVSTLDIGGPVTSISWDYTGRFLAAAGPSSVAVHAYNKSTKAWTEPLRKACNARAVGWGAQAKSIVILTEDGSLTTLS